MALKLKTSELRWIVILVLVLSGAWFYKNSYQPRHHKIQAMESKLRASNAKLETARKENTDLRTQEEATQNDIATLKKDSERLEQKLSLIKSNIPSKNALDRLLHAFIAPQYGIEIEAIKPLEEDHERYGQHQEQNREADTNDQSYHTVVYEITCSGAYQDIVRYLSYLEKLSNFSTITEANFVPTPEPKKEDSSKEDSKTEKHTAPAIRYPLEGHLKFAIRISNRPAGTGAAPAFEVDYEVPLEKLASPFKETKAQEEQKPEEETQEVKAVALPEIHVSGWISLGDETRAIIDHKIYKVGDTVGESLIKQIDKNKVTFETFGTLHEALVGRKQK